MRLLLFLIAITLQATAISCTAQGISDKCEKDFSDFEKVHQNIKNDRYFSGVIDDKSKLDNLGCLKLDNKSVIFIYYQREFGNYRLAQRLIVYSKDSGYVGMFEIADKPFLDVEKKILLFPYDESEGNRILFENGQIPTEVLLDGNIKNIYK